MGAVAAVVLVVGEEGSAGDPGDVGFANAGTSADAFDDGGSVGDDGGGPVGVAMKAVLLMKFLSMAG